MTAEVISIDEAKTQEQQVFMCQAGFEGKESGHCECQCHLLLEDGVIKCARCLMLSTFAWFVPHPIPAYLSKRDLRPKRSIVNPDLILHVCRHCGGSDMHLFNHGTVHCVRCKKQACARFELL